MFDRDNLCKIWRQSMQRLDCNRDQFYQEFGPYAADMRLWPLSDVAMRLMVISTLFGDTIGDTSCGLGYMADVYQYFSAVVEVLASMDIELSEEETSVGLFEMWSLYPYRHVAVAAGVMNASETACKLGFNKYLSRFYSGRCDAYNVMSVKEAVQHCSNVLSRLLPTDTAVVRIVAWHEVRLRSSDPDVRSLISLEALLELLGLNRHTYCEIVLSRGLRADNLVP